MPRDTPKGLDLGAFYTLRSGMLGQVKSKQVFQNGYSMSSETLLAPRNWDKGYSTGTAESQEKMTGILEISFLRRAFLQPPLTYQPWLPCKEVIHPLSIVSFLPVITACCLHWRFLAQNFKLPQCLYYFKISYEILKKN
jgi:hypothetical protein